MVGITMVHGFSKKGLPLFKPSRTVKVRHKVIRIFMGFLLFTSFVSPVPVRAIETTKASALVLEEMRGRHSLSFTKRSPSSNPAQADPCLSLLSTHPSPGASAYGVTPSSQPSRSSSGKTAVPVALSFVLGLRIALGPQEMVKPTKRVQFGPEIRVTGKKGSNRALAVAAYRSCKNEHTLSLHKNKKQADF